MDSGMSAGDILALSKNADGSFLEGNGIIILILFFLIFGFAGGGFGGGYNRATETALTQSELQNGLYNQSANADRLAIMQQNFDTSKEVLETRYQSALQSQQIQAQMAQCCCDTNRNIDAVRAENYKNTCEITNAVHAEGERTRALINENVMQELRDNLQAAQLQLGNLSQTNTLISTLRPFPQPAYITCSPYQASNIYGGCGNGCGNF